MRISHFYLSLLGFVALASDVRADWSRIECLKKCTNQSCSNPQTRSECDANCPETVLNGCHAASEMPPIVPPARRALSRPSSQGSETPSLSSSGAEVSPPVESDKLLFGPPPRPARAGVPLKRQERVTHDLAGGALSEENKPVSRPEIPDANERASDVGAPKAAPRRDLRRQERVTHGLGGGAAETRDAEYEREMSEMMDELAGGKLEGAEHQAGHGGGSAVSEPSRLGPPPPVPARRYSGSSSGRPPEREASLEGTPKRRSLGSSQAGSAASAAAAAAIIPDNEGKILSAAERAEIERRKRDEEAMRRLTPAERKRLDAEKFAQVLKLNEGQGTKVKDVKQKVQDSRDLYSHIEYRLQLMHQSPRQDKAKLAQLQENLELAHESLQKYMQSSGLSDPAIWANPESQIQHEPVFWSTVVGAIDNLNGATCIDIKTEGEELTKVAAKKRQAASIDPNIADYSGQVSGICGELKFSGMSYAKKIALAKTINNLYEKFSRRG